MVQHSWFCMRAALGKWLQPKSRVAHGHDRRQIKTRRQEGEANNVTHHQQSISKEDGIWLHFMEQQKNVAHIWSKQNWHIILSFNAVMGLSRVTRIRWKERITIQRESKRSQRDKLFLACVSLASSSPPYLWHHAEYYSVKLAAREKEVLSWAVICSN